MQIKRRTTLRSHRRHTLAAAASLLALVVLPIPAAAQTYWRVPGAIGGALVGAGVGWVIDVARAASEGVLGPDLIMTPVGMGVGGFVGYMAGLHTDRRLARGDTLRRGSRAVLRVTTFLAPVAVGSAVAFAIINPSDDEARCIPYEGPDAPPGCSRYEPAPKIASDETVLLVAIGGGAVIGFIAQHRFARALWPKARVNVAPTGRGVMVSIPVGW